MVFLKLHSIRFESVATDLLCASFIETARHNQAAATKSGLSLESGVRTSGNSLKGVVSTEQFAKALLGAEKPRVQSYFSDPICQAGPSQ